MNKTFFIFFTVFAIIFGGINANAQGKVSRKGSAVSNKSGVSSNKAPIKITDLLVKKSYGYGIRSNLTSFLKGLGFGKGNTSLVYNGPGDIDGVTTKVYATKYSRTSNNKKIVIIHEEEYWNGSKAITTESLELTFQDKADLNHFMKYIHSLNLIEEGTYYITDDCWCIESKGNKVKIWQEGGC